MKINFWRPLIIVAFFFLISLIWYLQELNEAVRKNNAILMEQKVALEKKVGDVYAQKKSIEAELSAVKQEKESLENKIAEFDKANRKLTVEIEKIKRELETANENIARRDAEIAGLTKKLEAYELEIASLKERIGRGPELFTPGTASKGREVVDLAPITIVSPNKKTDAKIIEVNKEYGFVVTNVGKDYGIQNDDTLFVFRGDKLLGRVIVEKVSGDVSIARIPYKSLASTIEKGDRISY